MIDNKDSFQEQELVDFFNSKVLSVPDQKFATLLKFNTPGVDY